MKMTAEDYDVEPLPKLRPVNWKRIREETTGWNIEPVFPSHPRVTKEDALAIRSLYSQGLSYSDISDALNVLLGDVINVLDGVIHPYVGGILKRPSVGIYFKDLTGDDRRFCIGCMNIARNVFSPFQFRTICGFNAMTPEEVSLVLQEQPKGKLHDGKNYRKRPIVPQEKGGIS